MLYKLTWQTKVFDDWGDPQFVIGDIGPIHRCYNALIVTHYQEFEGERVSDTLRAVVTAIQPDTTNDRGNVVYEWNWPISAPEEEEVAE
jgi:hypothetical protein